MPEPTKERAEPIGEMESLRRYYGVPAKRGGRVAYTWQGRREGTIMSADAHKLFIRFDDAGKREGPFHPTWEIEYLSALERIARGRFAGASYIAREALAPLSGESTSPGGDS